MSSSPGSGRVEKGAANVTEMGSVACKSRAVRNCRESDASREFGYHKCHGETSSMLKLVFDASVWSQGSSATTRMQPEPGELGVYLGVTEEVTRSVRSRRDAIVCAARGTASHLKHRGFLLGTREPRSGRRLCEGRQAAQSSNVPDGGRSLRSSPSAGEPRAWRREAVDA